MKKNISDKHKKVKKYHFSIRILHWLMAIILLGELILGFFMKKIVELSGYSSHQLFWLHKSLGVLIAFLFILRVIARFSTKIPPPLKTMKNYEKKLSGLVHFTLYCFMLLIPVSGVLMSNFHGSLVPFFVTDLPVLFSKNLETAKIFAEIHEFLAFGILIFITLHVLGAIKHMLFDTKKNSILTRML